jgi:drug/metabolite transporter (DMT)-like permease
VGVVAILGSSLGYAIAGVVIGRLVQRVDAPSVAAVRMAAAVLFVVPALFVLGAQGDVVRMEVHDIWQLIVAGLFGWGIGEPLYVLTIRLIGLTRSYVVVTGVYSLSAFAFPVMFLHEPLDWQDVLGALLVIAGVYLVALWGRRPMPAQIVSVRNLEPTAGAEWQDPHAVSSETIPNHPISWLARARLRLPGGASSMPRFALGIGFAIAVGIAWAIDTTWLRSAADGFDAAAVSIVHIPVAGFLVVGYVALSPRTALHARSLNRSTVLVLAVSSIISGGLGSILFIFAIQEIGSGPSAVLFATSPLFALPLGILFLHERITSWAVLGALIAVGGVALLA